MTPKQNPSSRQTQSKKKSFTSIRIMGEKAQRMLKSARKGLREDRAQKKPSLPKPRTREECVVHISPQSMIKATFVIFAIALGLYLVYHLRSKIILLMLAVFLAAVIDPGVAFLENRLRFPRGIAILVHYFIALFVVLFLLLSLIPIIASQLQQIAVFLSTEVDAFLANPQIGLPLVNEETNLRLTTLVQSGLQSLSINEFADALQQFGQDLSSAAQGSFLFAVQVAGSVVGFAISLILVLVLCFFIQLEKESIFTWLRSLTPHKWRTYLDHKSEAIHTKLGQWARGQLLLMLSIFSLTLIALIILRMPYALTLAVLAGFMEFIPGVGPFIAAIPAVLIALTQEGFIWGLVVAGVYYVIQWCENNLLVPLIMRRAVGLSPIAILFALMVGVSFSDTIHPILGVMLAVPATTILTIFLEDIRERE